MARRWRDVPEESSRAPGPVRPALAFFVVLLPFTLSCSSARPEVGRRAERAELEVEAKRLVERAEVPEDAGAAETLEALERFVRTAPSGYARDLVLLALARRHLELGDLASAAREVQSLLARPSASEAHRDRARLLEAALDTRRGAPERALTTLDGLRGRLFETGEKRLFAREYLRAVLESGRKDLVLEALLARLVLESAPPERARAEADKVLFSIDAAELREMPLPGLGDASRRVYATLVEERVEARLAGVALAQRDAELAREVLRRNPEWLRGTEDYEELVLLTKLLVDEAKVVGRRVGIVLGGRTSLERSRSLLVLAGFERELAVLGETAISVIAEEDVGSAPEALSRLAAEGALLLVAGFREPAALEALQFAEDRRMVVLAVAPPASVPPLDFGFVAGPSPERAERLLEEAAQRDGLAFETVHDESCRGGGGAHSLIVAAAPDCLRKLAALGEAHRFFLGMDVSGEPLERGVVAFHLASHRFPGAGSLVLSERRDEGRTAAPTRFYELLGRDLARLAREALSKLPPTLARDREVVRQRYAELRTALLDARASLETTEARGFSEARALDYSLRVVARDGGRVSEPRP